MHAYLGTQKSSQLFLRTEYFHMKWNYAFVTGQLQIDVYRGELCTVRFNGDAAIQLNRPEIVRGGG